MANEKKIVDIINYSRWGYWHTDDYRSYVIAIFNDGTSQIVMQYDAKEFYINVSTMYKNINKYDTVDKIRDKLINSKLIKRRDDVK